MAGQLPPIGLEGAQAPTDRLFFALFPDPAAAERIAQLAWALRREHGLKGRPLATERFHVTLHYLGDYAGLPPGMVDSAVEAARSVSMPPVKVAFDRVASLVGRAGKQPVVLRAGEAVAGLTGLRAALGAAMQKVGLNGDTNPHYTPHVTLLYGDRRLAQQTIERISWTAREFALVRSLLGQNRYVPLARSALR